MREIKFRAWNIVDEKMRVVLKIDFDIKLVWLDKYVKGERRPYWLEFKDVELMQYTGLKDKNGKEIYEGDIARTPFGIGQVFDRLGCWFVELQKELGYFPPFDIEVIGNVYENPDLIKEDENEI